MSQIQISLPHKKVELPSFVGSEVELKSISVGQQRTIREKYKLTSKSDLESKEAEDAMFEMVEKCIVDWNIYEGETKMSVNRETLDLLPQQDMQFLIAHVLGLKIPGQEKNG